MAHTVYDVSRGGERQKTGIALSKQSAQTAVRHGTPALLEHSKSAQLAQCLIAFIFRYESGSAKRRLLLVLLVLLVLVLLVLVLLVLLVLLMLEMQEVVGSYS